MNDIADALISHRGEMERWARGFCRTDAEDLVQTTCLKALENKESFKGGNVCCWLYRIMRNTFLDQRTMDEVDIDSLTFTVSMRMDRLDIEMCLESLSEKLRRVMRLYSYGYTTEEIARMVGCKEGTVASRIHNAKVSMRKMLV